MVDPDLALVEATARGDQAAFEMLVKRYQGPLLNFVAKFGDRDMAEDVTQEVFLRIHRAAPHFQARAKVSTWIFQIAYNQALTEIDRRGRQSDLKELLYQRREETIERPPFGTPEHFELAEEIISVLGQLPDNQRAALLLRANEELSFRQIGAILGVSVQSVESLLFRARTNLKRYFERK